MDLAALQKDSLQKRLSNNGTIVSAEGYNFELEKRGYLQHGSFAPMVILEKPEVVKSLHEEFVHAGSEVVVAVTYFAHRKKLREIGLEDKVEDLNRKAIAIARDVAKATGTLLAGNICNTVVYQSDSEDAQRNAEAIFKEQIEWAVDEGVDFILAETFSDLGEAMLALECVQKYGRGVPAVVNLTPTTRDVTFDGVPFPEACRQLEKAGAAVVGLNCGRGPTTMLPLIREVRKACKGPIACFPVGYRTSPTSPTMQSLTDPITGERDFPTNMCAHGCSRGEIQTFAEACKEIGVQFVGVCCGNTSIYTRIVAEVYNRTPPSSKYSPDMTIHSQFGGKSNQYNKELGKWKTGL